MACVGGLGLAWLVPAPQPLLLPRPDARDRRLRDRRMRAGRRGLGIRRRAARHGAPRAGGAVINPAAISRV
jgi:hypothetical protein